jgi:hypothetical protein
MPYFSPKGVIFHCQQIKKICTPFLPQRGKKTGLSIPIPLKPPLRFAG